MREYQKNKNEYREDGKLYIVNVKKCTCDERIGTEHVVVCKIIQRGEHEYMYNVGESYITKRGGEKRIYLSEEAQKTVEAAADDFDAQVEGIKDGDYAKIKLNALKSVLYYKHAGKDRFDIMLKTEGPDKKNIISISKGINLDRLIRKITMVRNRDDNIAKKVSDLILRSTKDNIVHNPLYTSAVENNDELLQKQLRIYYGIATEKECTWLQKLFGKRILPTLPKEYDRNYVVDADTIKGGILYDSGYRILHRPYFAMMGSTHSKWQLNPHKKTGVDAAKDDQESMSFCDFLELFEN